MSILPSQYEGAAKPRQRMAMRSLSPAPPSFARSNSSSSITSPPAPTTLGPEAIFRPGTPFSPSVGNSPLLDGADHQDIDLSPPSPERVPKVIPYVPSKGTRRRSNTLETGGRGGWNGWKERQLKMLAKRGWTTQALAWRFSALFLLGLFFLSGRIKKSWEDHDAAIIQRGQDKFPKLVTPLHLQKPTAVEEPDEVFLDHEFSPDGFLRSSLSLSQRHPIWEMIDQATEHYNLAVQSQALSLGNFVDHYKKANGRKPPIHFDLLYPHVLKSRPYSPIPSPSSLHMYNSVTPYLLHERQLTSEAFYELNPDHEPPTPEEDSGRFVLVIENGEVKTEWPWNPMVDGAELEGDDGGLKDRLQEWMNKPEWQGKIGDLRITVSMDEHNPQLIPFSYVEAAKRRALKNHFEMDQGELRKAEHDWTLGCDPTSALVKKRAGGFGMRMRNRAGAFSPHFVHNPIAATDICQHPALRPLSDVMASYPQPLEVDTRPVPQLAARAGLGKLGADILTLGVGHPSYHAPRVVPWSQKVGTAAFWRGPPPVFHSPLTPHVAHRLSTAFRVALLPTTPIDTHSFPLTLVPPPNVVAREGGGAEQHDGQQVSEGFSYNPEERISMEIWDRKRLLDIAFVTDNEEDKLGCRGMNGCEYLSSRVNYDSSGKNAAHQKYVFVFEGDDPTAAFESGSLVLHSSPLALSAWQTKAIPWHDYIPVSPDFSDLPSILLFLRANDDVAERIATNGQEFGRKVLNKDAGTVAVLGQLLEYARVWSVGRAEMDYAGHH